MTERTAKLGQQLIRFEHRFRTDADVLECRTCGARYHLSFAWQDMRHKEGCSETEIRPWYLYTELISQVLPQEGGATPEDLGIGYRLHFGINQETGAREYTAVIIDGPIECAGGYGSTARAALEAAVRDWLVLRHAAAPRRAGDD